MVLIMVLAAVKPRDRYVHPRVVQRWQKPCAKRKHTNRRHVQRHQIRDDGYRQQMEVLADQVLKRVLVDRILYAVRRDHLLMVVLVDGRVDRAVVERPVEERVEEIVDDEQHRERQRCVLERDC